MQSKKTELSHSEMVTIVSENIFKQTPRSIERIAIGICNEVYKVKIQDREVIVRLSNLDRFLKGSQEHIPQFKALGITVPDIIAEDYSRSIVPVAYQIQSKIEGKDLGLVIETMSDEQLRDLAKEIASIFKKVATIPSSSKFGLIWGGGATELSDTWTERMRIWIDESKERGEPTGVMDEYLSNLAEKIYSDYKSYFDFITPVVYYGDISSKNVMIDNGAFNGLVDLDGLTQGDYLEAVGRIKLSWYGTPYGEIYTNALIEKLGLNEEQKKMVTMYAMLNAIAWACENGVRFNENTTTEVDKDKEARDKARINLIAKELYGN
jgi:aminoglycoside phosphotransferase (APT) family kinase protein